MRESSSAKPDTRRVLAGLASAMLCAVFAGYGWTLRGYFVGDDFAHIGRYFAFPWQEWPALFARGWADDLWSHLLRELRPFNALAFMLDARAWGLNPLGFRVTNVLLHIACATLVGLIAWRVSRRSRACAFIAALGFALHPVCAHGVAWISGRVDLLVTALELGAVLAFLKFREEKSASRAPLVALAACTAAALFTKESALTLPPLLVAADLAWLGRTRALHQARTWAPHLVVAAAVGIYLLCRQVAFGAAGPNSIGHGWPDFASGAFWQDFTWRGVRYATNLFPPSFGWLKAWHDAGRPFDLAHLGRGALLLLFAGAVVAVVLHAWRRAATVERRALLFFSIGWCAITVLPLVLTYYSARHLYPAAAGLSIAAALALRLAFPRGPALAAASLAVATLLTTQLVATLRPWRDAARISGVIAAEIERAARTAPAGSLLVLDVPARIDDAFCWAWAQPYAVRPPFASARHEDRVRFLAAPASDAFYADWLEQSAHTLAAVTGKPAQLLRVTPDGAIERRDISADTLGAAAVFLTAPKPALPEMAWRGFLGALDGRANRPR